MKNKEVIGKKNYTFAAIAICKAGRQNRRSVHSSTPYSMILPSLEM